MCFFFNIEYNVELFQKVKCSSKCKVILNNILNRLNYWSFLNLWLFLNPLKLISLNIDKTHLNITFNLIPFQTLYT